MNQADIHDLFDRLTLIRPTGAPEPHTPRAHAILDEWTRILTPLNTNHTILGDRLCTHDRWPSIGQVTDTARSLASAPTPDNNCHHCDNERWKPGRTETRTTTNPTDPDHEHRIEYPTLHPCPSCRPTQYARWRDGAYRPTGTAA